jgi:predicted nucleic acid-binding protein
MSDRVFFDTNIFVYLNSADDPEKKEIARRAINTFDGVVSTQVVGELCNVLLRKFGTAAGIVKETVAAIDATVSVVPVSVSTMGKAIDIRERYAYSFYDSLILAAALESDCAYVFSEDMQDGQDLEQKLKIVNIFAHPNFEL